MNHIYLTPLIAILLLTGCLKKPAPLKTQEQKESYAIGNSIGKDLKRNFSTFSTPQFIKGIEDAFSETSTLASDEIKTLVDNYQKRMQEEQKVKQVAQQKALKTLGDQNIKQGLAFLKENKNKKGVKTLKSGLQYKVIKRGNGKVKPKATDNVTVNYKGTLIDGTEFDSSYKRETPATFRLNQVIPGWTEGLQYMREGDRFQFFIPSSLAYGERQAGQIGPNATLIFEVDLIKIN